MKPFVICHMCTTIDGKILSNRWDKLTGGQGAGGLFETTAAQFGVGAWLVGTTTMKEFSGRGVRLPTRSPRIGKEDHVADRTARSFAIGVDPKGILRFGKGEVDGDHVILLITRRAGNAYLAGLQKAGVSYLFCGDKEVDLPIALDKLHRLFAIKKLMLQGGGKFNGSMLHAGLVDEISQVIVPVADGGMGVASFFDIPGPAPKKAAAALRLISYRKLPGSVSWFRYRVR